jgi:hypothetical protein
MTTLMDYCRAIAKNLQANICPHDKNKDSMFVQYNMPKHQNECIECIAEFLCQEITEAKEK